jgi:hypothetical protein
VRELRPTKTRLALLEAVAAGKVYDLPHGDEEQLSTWDTTGAEWGEKARRVTARIDEMIQAGWVCVGRNFAQWELTAAGREVLDANVWREVTG